MKANPGKPMKSKGICPVCGWPVKRGEVRKQVKGIRRYYHSGCVKYIKK